MHGKARAVGPYSRPTSLAKLDQRTREARLMQAVRIELVAHVGGKPSAVQAALIERLAWLALHIEQINVRAVESGGLSERDSRMYLAWANTYERGLRNLGVATHQARPSRSNIPKVPGETSRNNKDSERSTWSRLVQVLVAKRRIVVNGDWIALAKQAET